MHERDVELFNDSIEWCSCRSDFLNRFYTLFLASSDTVAKKFEHTDLRKQARVLKTSLYIMMAASDESERTVHLERLAKLHSRAELDIKPELTGWSRPSRNSTRCLTRKSKLPGGACYNPESNS